MELVGKGNNEFLRLLLNFIELPSAKFALDCNSNLCEVVHHPAPSLAPVVNQLYLS